MARPGLHVDADVAAVDGQREGLGGRQAAAELAVDQQAHTSPNVTAVDQIVDVDAAVAQRAAVLVGFGDLGGEGDDALEPLDEVFRYGSHAQILAPEPRAPCAESVTSQTSGAGRAGRRGVAWSRGNSRRRAPGADARRVRIGREGRQPRPRRRLARRRLDRVAAQVVSRRRTRRASPSRTPWWSARSTPQGRPATRTVLCKSVDEAGITLLHQLRLRQGRAARRHAVRVGDVPVVRARPPGARPRAGDQGLRRRRPPTIGPSGRAVRSSVRGRRTSRSRSPRAKHCGSSSPT